ncbi:MAG: tRNA (adenosine(37)-N6)-threonylcarbamoyltransferase complex dimerization subunit type 1 TsaB [Thermodesulfovibrio sp.]|nr:tRNA (adenosine(37)-N6)-threonylcarbamoyltransferase complex dimerization subunit type 1 TsaB [Thermodesulfovibrio sp.]
MKILAIETSTILGGIAVADAGRGLIAEARLNVKTTHSERLMTVIGQVMEQSGLRLEEIDLFAVASGPGSFTGLRIGLSTAKGLAYATGKPMVTVPTLEAFAWSFAFSRYPVCIMLDARRDEVYTALFRWEGDTFVREIAETSVKPDELLTRLEGTVLFAGEGTLVYRDKIVSALGKRAVFAPADRMVPSPASLAVLGLDRAAAGHCTDPFGAAPLYIRRSEAEVKLDEKMKAPSTGLG